MTYLGCKSLILGFLCEILNKYDYLIKLHSARNKTFFLQAGKGACFVVQPSPLGYGFIKLREILLPAAQLDPAPTSREWFHLHSKKHTVPVRSPDTVPAQRVCKRSQVLSR